MIISVWLLTYVTKLYRIFIFSFSKVKMVTITSTGKELLSRLSKNISVQSFNPSTSESIPSSKSTIPSIEFMPSQNLPSGMSVFSVAQDSTKRANVQERVEQNVSNMNKIAKPEDEL